MKKLFTILVVAMMCGISECMAQNSGLGFNYQAVVRKADGVLMSNSDVTLRISLYPGQTSLTPTWVETHKVKTDVSGCFGITVGKGTRASNSVVAKFSDVNFAAVYYWMKIEVQDGSSYREISFSQLPSAPYSEVAHNASIFPVGMIVPFAGPAENIPDGWMLCDGKIVSRSEYINLYNAIGVAWGSGDGSTTFAIPDLRGMFLRGVSGDSGRDADADNRLSHLDGGNMGNNVGSFQRDAIRNITGEAFGTPSYSHRDIVNSGAFARPGVLATVSPDNYRVISGHLGFDASLSVGAEHVGSDNRPMNVYVNYIIKY